MTQGQVSPDGKWMWNGAEWVANPNVQSFEPPNSSGAGEPSLPVRSLVTFAVLGLAVVGLALAIQSASLLTGTGMQWAGAVLSALAAIGAFVCRRTISGYTIVGAVIAALLALASVIYLEVQMEQRRQEIGEIFNDF